MNLVKNTGIVIGLALIGVLFYHTVTARADNTPPLSESHKQRIVANCTSALSSLSQLHRSDGLVRVNRGQLYEFVGTKLMARLNSRLALNRLDAGELVALAARYDKALDNFRKTYIRYEERISSVSKIDCAKHPEDFYYSVADVRAKRAAVYQRTQEVNGIINDFYQAFGRFSQGYKEAVKEVTNE